MKKTNNKNRKEAEKFKPTDLVNEIDEIVAHLNLLLGTVKSTDFLIGNDPDEDPIQNIKRLETINPKDGWDTIIIVFKAQNLRIKQDLAFVIPNSLGKIFSGNGPGHWDLMKDNNSTEYMLARVAVSTRDRMNVSRPSASDGMTKTDRVFIIKEFFYKKGEVWMELTDSGDGTSGIPTYGVLRNDVDFALQLKTLYKDLDLFTADVNQKGTTTKIKLKKIKGKLYDKLKKKS